MKSILLITSILLCTSVLHAQITDPSPYCTAGYNDLGDGYYMPIPHYISNVMLGTLNDTTGTVQFPAPHYRYYNSVAAPVLKIDSSYTLSVTYDFTSNHFVAAYIDFNQDNIFEDSERVLEQSEIAGTMTNPAVTIVAVPASAVVGTTRMRVLTFEDDNYTFVGGYTHATPCTGDTLSWGETVDYNVTIAHAIAPAPVAAFTVSPLTGTTATVFNFTDESTNAPASRTWTFIPNTVAYESGTTNASANPVVKFTAPGLYSAKLLVANASGSDSLTKASYITVTGSTGVNEINATGDLLIYPNPAKNYIFIDQTLLGADIKITDAQGRLVQQGKVSNSNLDITSLAAGIYFVRIVKDSNIYTQLLNVEK